MRPSFLKLSLKDLSLLRPPRTVALGSRRLPVLAVVALSAACGSAPAEQTDNSQGITVQVASYDLSVGRQQRVIAGLLAEGGAKLVSFGSFDFAFTYLGTKDKPIKQGPVGSPMAAAFQPIAGQRVASDQSGARLVTGSEGVGVYAAPEVRFDRPGLWGLTVTGQLNGKPLEVKADFVVRSEPAVPVPGDAAPRTENLLPGAADAPAKAVDSRAEPDGKVPDPELHSQTVAQALATGKPTMVVISTPVYCQSRFCGPITDSVQALASRHQDTMNFVHLEVWRDFQGQVINKSAAEWIYRTQTEDINEPWVFVVDGAGKITHRFDNVASDAELENAVAEVLR